MQKTKSIITFEKKCLGISHNNNNNNMLIVEKVDKVRKRIRTLRNQKEYSQDYIADRLGIDQRAYHRLENGYTKLKVEMLFKLAIVLEVLPSYFLEE
ncbi:MAG: helix-turn-helix domain-containing protein [Polaribacter sp.]